MSFLSRLFNRVPPRDQLVIDLIDELKRRGIQTQGGTYNHQDYSLTVEGRKLGLGNLFLEWRLRRRRDKAELVKRFLDSVLQIGKPLPSFDAAAEKLVPLVRSRSNICLWLLEAWCGGAPDGNAAETAWAPFVGDLVTAVGLDMGSGISRMERSNLEHLGVTLDTAFQRALANLQRGAPRLVFGQVGHGMPRGVFHSDSASDYQSSMLLLPDRFPRLPEGDGDLVAMVPGRNSMWITGSRNEAGISALFDVGEKSLSSLHHRCSTTLLRLDGGRWVPFAPDSNESLATRYQTLVKKQEATDYALQKSVLEQLHRARSDPAYVAPFNLSLKSDASRSWVAWASGVDSMLLPRAEFMIFVEQILDGTGRAIGSKRSIEVAWDSASPLVRDLMEEVPDLYPLRYRAGRFPDAAVLAELERRGRRYEGVVPADTIPQGR
jgi:hypothetical protein